MPDPEPIAPSQLRLGLEDEGMQELWTEILARVETRIGREAVESWLKDTTPIHIDAERLRIAVPNGTARTWIDKKYSSALREAICAIHGEALTLELVVGKGSARAQKPAKSRNEPPRAPARPAPAALFAPIPLNEKYTFDNFVVGQSNRFAHAAAAAVAEHPGREFNPLFIYGGVGLGKTHLLQAVGHELQARNPNTRIAYVSGETFTSHFITSLREHREEDFRRAYRGVDIWLVDDIQFIADKTSTKEEFFHTFNELYLTNRQIVLASDRPPRELRLMEDRLRTRLESGLMVEIAAPELETRMAILEKRAAMEGVQIPPEVLYQLARSVSTNIRLLEAALIRMLALASLNRSQITLDLASRALSAFVQENPISTINWLAVQQAVCEHFQVGEQELVSPRRDRQTCLARQVAMYLMRELSRKSLSEIGQLFGGKAHSTVLYACDKLEREMKSDPSLDAAIRGLRSEIAGRGS
jgi:chromosomal replication initiator protein